MSSQPSMDAVRPDTAQPTPLPQIADHAVDPIVLTPDPIVTGLKIANAIWVAVNGSRRTR